MGVMARISEKSSHFKKNSAQISSPIFGYFFPKPNIRSEMRGRLRAAEQMQAPYGPQIK